MTSPGLLRLLASCLTLGTATLGGVALQPPPHPPADGEITLGHETELPVKRVARFSSWYAQRMKRSRELLANSLESRLHPDAPQQMLSNSLEGGAKEAEANNHTECAGGPCDKKELNEMSRTELENELRYANAKRIDKKATWELRKSDVLKAKSSKTVAEAHGDGAAIAEAREEIEQKKARAAEADAEHKAAHDYHQEVAAQLEKQGYTEQEVRNTYAESDDVQSEKIEEEYGRDSMGEELARAEAEEEAKEAQEAKDAAEKKASRSVQEEEESEAAKEDAEERTAEVAAEAVEEEHTAAEHADQVESAKADSVKVDRVVKAGGEEAANTADKVEGTVRDANNQNAWLRSPTKKANAGQTLVVPWWGAPDTNPAQPGTNTGDELKGGSRPAVFPVLALFTSLAVMHL